MTQHVREQVADSKANVRMTAAPGQVLTWPLLSLCAGPLDLRLCGEAQPGAGRRVAGHRSSGRQADGAGSGRGKGPGSEGFRHCYSQSAPVPS